MHLSHTIDFIKGLMSIQPKSGQLIAAPFLVATAEVMALSQQVFEERLDACFPKVKRFGVPYPEITIRSMEKHWGSCTAVGRLTLNPKLIQVPKSYIDYVILHELCHIKEHHHGPAFYSLFDRVLPDWREKREGLHQVELT